MKELDIKIEMREALSLASQQNGYPLLRKLRVKNKSHEMAHEVRVHLTFDPAFASCDDILLGDIPAGKSIDVENIPVTISTDYIANLTESVTGTFTDRIYNLQLCLQQSALYVSNSKYGCEQILKELRSLGQEPPSNVLELMNRFGLK